MDSEYKRILSPSLAFLILAALTPDEHTVYVEDENVQKINFNDQPDLVGISVNVDTSIKAYRIASHYRAKGIPVILGGIHVSANPEEALKHADSVCIGEAEELWRHILNDAANGRLKSQYYMPWPTDPANIPIPKWDVLDRSKYLYTNILFASRGCPFQCDFCYNSCNYVHHRYRNRPIETVVREIEQMGTRHIMFIDDNFIGNVDWVREFTRAIKPLDLKWNVAVSANIGNHLDLLDKMHESGCKSLFIGFESINSQSIQSVNKVQNHREDYEKMIREIHARDIMINASIVFGFDHDYPNVFDNTVNWLIDNKIETMTSHILTPYPGTAIYKRLLAENRIVDFDPAHYNTAHAVFIPKNMSREELYQGYIETYRTFYSLKNIFRRLPESPKQKIAYLLFNFFYRRFGNVTSKLAKAGLVNRVGKVARRLSYGIG
jgi:radical SAM superfamily enzyme YgiQ (UPF0313 family)